MSFITLFICSQLFINLSVVQSEIMIEEWNEMLNKYGHSIKPDNMIKTTQADGTHDRDKINKVLESFEFYLYNIIEHVIKENKLFINKNKSVGEITPTMKFDTPLSFTQIEINICNNFPR